MILLSWVLLLFVLYKFATVGLEQRYFIWSWHFLKTTRRVHLCAPEVQEFLKIGMTASPWGESGLNLHSGIFESLVFKGVLSTLLVGVAIFWPHLIPVLLNLLYFFISL